MTGRVRAYCKHDHEVELNAAAVRVAALKKGGVYMFVCPQCGVFTVKPTNDNNLRLLLEAGAHTGAWQDEEMLP